MTEVSLGDWLRCGVTGKFNMPRSLLVVETGLAGPRVLQAPIHKVCKEELFLEMVPLKVVSMPRHWMLLETSLVEQRLQLRVKST